MGYVMLILVLLVLLAIGAGGAAEDFGRNQHDSDQDDFPGSCDP
jgi:hypothetical protein